MGRPRHNLAGRVFGELLAITPIGRVSKQNKAFYWECICNCGKTSLVQSSNLLSGRTKSCGCKKLLQGEKNPSYRHGKTLTPEYVAYQSAKRRCNNPSTTGYERYGGRGIRFLFDSFYEWLDHLSLRPTSLHSVDRINPHGHYMPGNVRWATKSEQVKNRVKFGAITRFSVEELQKELARRQRCTVR